MVYFCKSSEKVELIGKTQLFHCLGLFKSVEVLGMRARTVSFFSFKKTAFSLIELVITLALVGVLAAFSVPQLFMTTATQNTAKYTNMAHDVALMVSTAYERYRAANASTTLAMFSDLAAYYELCKTGYLRFNYI